MGFSLRGHPGAQKGPRVLTRGLADLVAAGHAGNFLNAIRTFHAGDARECAPVADGLLHFEMSVGERGDLREVRDAEYLMMGGQLGQSSAHAIGGAPPWRFC